MGSDRTNPTADRVLGTFLSTWLRCFGPPEELISDGGPEFKGVFEENIERVGLFHHAANAESWKMEELRDMGS